MGSFPHFDQFGDENHKGEGGKEKGKKKRGRKLIERGRKGEKKKREIFSAFRRSNLDGSRVKVNPCNQGYPWVPKSGSFVKFKKIGNFPTLIIFSLKVI